MWPNIAITAQEESERGLGGSIHLKMGQNSMFGGVCVRACVRVCASEFVGKRAHTRVLLIGTVGGVLE